MLENIVLIRSGGPEAKGLKVHELPAALDIPVSRDRRDYYKMGLITGDMTISYGDQL